MKKALVSVVIFFIVLALAIVIIINSDSQGKKASKMPTIKPKAISAKSSKLILGEITVSYKYLHEPPNDHVDVAIVFATNKPAKVTIKYGEGLESELKSNEIYKKYIKEHYIVIHEVEPATNFTYQITAITAAGENVKSEHLAFLTPPHKRVNNDDGGFFSKILSTAKTLFATE